ncbi:chondroitin proteoglycan-2-like [Onthophagus taurus]|uniref:chondroitin proteoglycan-2-like n=1 Tax=Onthophagus taurus TaxID=166361 RepID=UPI0039BE7E34
MMDRRKIIVVLTILATFAAQAVAFICTPDNDFVAPHISSCTTYFKCKNGQYHLYECPDGLHFSLITGECESPADAQCPWASEDETEQEEESEIIGTSSEELEGECDGQGFVPHPSICSKFIECHNGVGKIHNCLPGFYFNKETGSCDIPDNGICNLNAENLPNDDIDLGIACSLDDYFYLPHPRSCQLYIRCRNGIVTVLTCWDGFYWNTAANRCDLAQTVDCVIDASSEEVSDESSVPETTTLVTTSAEETSSSDATEPWTTTTQQTTEGQGTVTTPPTTEQQWTTTSQWASEEEWTTTEETVLNCDASKCPSVNGEFPVYLPHEDCTKFCVCDWGKAHILDCPSGLHFNPKLNVCDWPQNAGCSGSNTNKPTDATTSTPTKTTTTETTTTPSTEPGYCDNNKCPPLNEKYPIFFPHEDCGRYCKCDWGVAFEMKCPDGLHFNPQMNVCDWPKDAGCIGSTNKPTEGTSETTENTTTDITTPIDKSGSCDTEQCPATNEKYPIFFPHEDCSKYCKCDWGVVFEMMCPDGMHFNPNLNVCDNPEDAGCETKTVTTTEKNQQSTTDNINMNPDGECNQINGEYVEFLTDRYHCDRFYKCNWGVPVLTFCPNGLHFNPTENVCDSREKAGCRAHWTSTEMTTEGTTTKATTPIETTSLETTTEELITEYVPLDPREDGPNGSCGTTNSIQFLPDKLHCNRYYICNWGTPVLQYCSPDTLHFNPVLNVCDWAWSAGCSAGQK